MTMPAMPFATASFLAILVGVGMAASLAGGAAFAAVLRGARPSVLAVAALSLVLLG
jgi:hypothetical protein